MKIVTTKYSSMIAVENGVLPGIKGIATRWRIISKNVPKDTFIALMTNSTTGGMTEMATESGVEDVEFIEERLTKESQNKLEAARELIRQADAWEVV